MTPERKNSLLIHLAVMLFGFSGLYAKIIPLPSIVIVWGRVIFATLVLYFFSTKNIKYKLKKKDYLQLFLLGALLTVHWITFFESIQLSSVGVGLVSFSTFPIFVIFYEMIFRKYSIKKFDIISIFFVLLGVVLIIPDYNFGNNIFSGILMGIISAITFAVLTIKNKDLVPKVGSINLAYYQYFYASILLTPVLFFVPFSFSFPDLLNLILLGVFFTAIAHTVYIKSLKYISPKKAAIIACLEPVYGIIFAVFVLGELPEIRVIFGGLCIIGIIIFVTLKKE